MSAGPVQAAVARAQASLDQARNELDVAMLSLAAIDGDTVLANAELVALLLRVVTARRYLEGLSAPGRPLGARHPALSPRDQGPKAPAIGLAAAGSTMGAMSDAPHRHFTMLRTFRPADLVTLLNGGAGAGALLAFMRFCVDADRTYFWLGAALLPIAFIMDALDGQIARKTGKGSPLGKDLDSLADVVSFGVAPAAPPGSPGCTLRRHRRRSRTRAAATPSARPCN